MKTLSILPILCSNFSPRNVEATIKYFLVQSFRAALILNAALIQAWLYSSWSITHPLKTFTSIIFTLALRLKLGLFPCHYWFPDVIQGVNFVQGLILSTWQKVAPLVILFYICRKMIKKTCLIIIGVLSALVGGWAGLNQTQVRKILAFSSIRHMGWICRIISYSPKTRMVMMLVYIIINSSAFILRNELRLNNLSLLGRISTISSTAGVFLGVVVLSLGGLPPLTGFIKKFLGLKCLIHKSSFAARVILIISRLLRLFFYLRIAFNSSLIFFPQHSLTMFSWRKREKVKNSVTGLSMILCILVCLRIFGLSTFPLLSSL